ncbi:hypothetical protein ATPR_3308 [Acetobacter tropicalis NBRC 101654]|uniref:Uncharacterized protein n=1 Tax=Acetobacter tropicalis NBRC 101654 TaxID=749388 RepID=F7VIV9_9PROT|nr:hypothetical protein ATPR_3308 [Acetobacter tropicalis NBRC 101654]
MGGLIGDAHIDPRWQCGPEFGHDLVEARDDRQRITGRRGFKTDEDRGSRRWFAVRRAQRAGLGTGVGIVRSEFRAPDIADPDDPATNRAQDHVAEFFHAFEVGVEVDVADCIDAPDPAGCGLEIVLPDGLGDVFTRHAVRGQLFGIEPQAHREALLAEIADLRHTIDPREHRCRDAVNVIGNLIEWPRRAGEGDIGDGGEAARGAFDDRIIRAFRQPVFDCVHLGHDVGQGAHGIVIQHHAHRHHAEALRGGGGEVVDPLDGGDGLADRLGHETLHEIGGRARIAGRHHDRRGFQRRVLAGRDAAQRADAEQDDQDRHDDREHRTPKEAVCEGHCASSRRPARGRTSGISRTFIPVTRRFWPLVTTRSSGFTPSSMTTHPLRRSPARTAVAVTMGPSVEGCSTKSVSP